MVNKEKIVKVFERDFGLHIVSLNKIPEGAINDSYKIVTSDEDFVLRIYSPKTYLGVKTIEHINEELEIIELMNSIIKTPKIVLNRTGKKVSSVENCYYVVFEFACMHSEIYIRKLVTDRGWFGNAFIDYAISKIEVSQLLPEEKEEYCIIKGLLKSNPKNIAKNIFLLHGDIHLGNVLVNNGVPYLIDFDSIQRGHFEQDIANHIMMTPFKAVLEDKNYIIDNSHIKTFLKGYELHSPLAINKPLLELYCRVIRLLLLIDYRGRMDNKMLKDYALRSISILDYFTE